MKLLPAFVGMPERNRVYKVDWRVLLAAMPDQSVDAYITDLPYGTTACTWDEIIPFEPMWREVKRTLKPRGVFVTTASQPFTSKLVMSNLEWFKYEWIWDKGRGVNFANANRQPMKSHENILIFAGLPSMYYPQYWYSTPYHVRPGNRAAEIEGLRGGSAAKFRPETISENGERYPLTVLNFNSNIGLHPTQKPVALYEYLIATYTQPGDLVVDFCCGSGTTAVAARNLKRDFIVGDSDAHYCHVAQERLRTSITEPHYIQPQNDLSGLPLFEMSDMRNKASGG